MTKAGRYHKVVESKDIADIAHIVKIILEIEDAVEEVLADLDVSYSGYSISDLGKDDNIVYVYINIDGECYREKHVGGSVIKIMCRHTTPNVNDVYSHIALRLTKISTNLLRPFLSKDSEYMVVLLDRGIAVVLEGSSKKITLPEMPGTLFACHTHPGTLVPVFSRDDARSILGILSNRGLGGCVLSSIACFTMFRCGPFLLDDYFSLLKVINEYGYLDEELLKSLHLKSVNGFLLST